MDKTKNSGGKFRITRKNKSRRPLGKENNKQDFSDEYSSRIKKIIIQLHDYHYYHGPYKEIFGDNRFIGRKAILTKLKSLFTSSEYKSGVYLITGYRGSGKTSLVNKAIDEINNRVKLLKGNKIAYCLVLMFYVLFSYFLIPFTGHKAGPIIIEVTGIALLMLMMGYLLYYGIQKRKRKPAWMKTRDLIYEFFRKHLLIRDLKHHEKKSFDSYLPWISLTAIPLFFTSFKILSVGDSISSISILRWLAGIFFGLVLGNIIYNGMKYFQGYKDRGARFWKFIYGLLKFNTNIFIKLNLGQRKLREIDILRLLARNVRTEYTKYYRHKTLFQILISVGLFYFIYIFSYLFYYQQNIYNAHNHLKERCRITEYLPSQDNEILGPDDSRKKKEILFNNMKALYENFPVEEEKNSQVQIEHKTVVEFLWDKVSFTVSYGVILVDCYLYAVYDKARNLLVDGFLFGFPDTIEAFINKNKTYSTRFSLIPYHLDYFFLTYVVLLYIIIKRIFINGLFLSARPRKIKKKIDELNEIIVSEVTVDKLTVSQESTNFNLFTFLSPKTKKRTVADVREIEKTLIDIFEEIDRIKFPFSRPDIIVVFDELDKIETHTYLYEKPADEKRDAESGGGSLNKTPNPSFTIDGTRERQQALQLLLSNLKYFLSDAKAKFIFIAGREMYDASLADISDRNYFMGSIFHKVINVNSFLSDNTDKRPSDITGMIERYVCQFLIHPDYIEHIKHKEKKHNPNVEKENLDYYTLAYFNSYLIASFRELDEKNENATVAAQILARQKREKILTLMQRFIIYLTHASNGAPKKVTNYFENFVQFRTIDSKTPENKHYILYTLKYPKRIRQEENAYLVFNYNKQYELGLINYITLPIILTISNHIKNFGDKLLVSATFLCDHLLKFHRDGFSWRNVEYIPEILEINRTPELRAFISNILDFLLQTHLQTILSGLYSFRFNQRLSNEISFLSKVSEEASASFNFTLDESLAIKHYYHSLLYRLEERYRKITSNRTEFIHSIAMVHAVLGDLYFYDEEYNDAILEYMDSIQYLRYSGFSDENFSLLLILVRNMLKLGLSFEKRKTYNSAFETYKELCYLLIHRRDIDLKELGLEEKLKDGKIVLTSPDVSTYEKHDVFHEWVSRQTYKDEYVLKNKFDDFFPLAADINTDRHNSGKNISFSDKDNFINQLTEQLNPVVEKILGKISSFEGLRLIYQPLLARLQIMEKCIMGGITKIDVFRTEVEFGYLQKAIDQKEKLFLKIEFYNKLGDILYFKRGNIKFKQDDNTVRDCQCWITGKDPKSTPPQYKDFVHYLTPSDSPDSVENKKLKLNGPSLNCAACLFYKKSIELFVRYYLSQLRPGLITDPEKPMNLSRSFTHIFLRYNDFSGSSHTPVKILAEMISDLADAKLGCINFKLEKSDLKALRPFLNDPKRGLGPNVNIRTIVSVIREEIVPFSAIGILRMFYLSALFYKKAGDYREYVWQLTKILYLVKEIIQNSTSVKEPAGLGFTEEHADNLIADCEKNIVRRAIRGCWSAYENAHMHEVSRHIEIMNMRSNDNKKDSKRSTAKNEDSTKPTSLKRISVNNDIEEITMLFSEIKLLVHDCCPSKATKVSWQGNTRILKGIVIDHYLLNLVSPYSDADSVYNRILRLNYKVKLNHRLFMQVISGVFCEDIQDLDILDIEKNESRDKENINTYWYQKILNLIIRNEGILNSSVTLSSGEGNAEETLTMSRLFSHLLGDSIYCLNEIIEIANAYGRSYILNHSYIAGAYQKMMFWSVWFTALKSYNIFYTNRQADIGKVIIDDAKFELLGNLFETTDNLLKSWMDTDSLQSLSIFYHAEMSIKRYYSAYETHVEGNAYKNFIDRMVFLNDDFNDKHSHFFTAYERFGFNNKNFIDTVNRLRVLNGSSGLFNYDNYIQTKMS